MLRNIATRNRLVGCWFAAVAVIVGSMVAMGVNVNVSTSAILLTLSLVPPVIVLALWRSAPPTVGEVLYTANTRQEGRS
jgi:hypothetical protein